MSSIITTKLPDGRDMSIISGSVYVEVGCLNPENHQTNLSQTAWNDDPGLVGFHFIDYTPDHWVHFEQRIAVGPKWDELDVKDIVPVVSPVIISTKDVSNQWNLTPEGSDEFVEK